MKRVEWIEDYFYQIAAYALAHEDNYGPINKGVICMCTKDLVYQQFDITKDKLNEYKDKWLEKVHQYSKSNS
jgi:genome maintenance exonuclease 1